MIKSKLKPEISIKKKSESYKLKPMNCILFYLVDDGLLFLCLVDSVDTGRPRSRPLGVEPRGKHTCILGLCRLMTSSYCIFVNF